MSLHYPQGEAWALRRVGLGHHLTVSPRSLLQTLQHPPQPPGALPQPTRAVARQPELLVAPNDMLQLPAKGAGVCFAAYAKSAAHAQPGHGQRILEFGYDQ